MKKSFLRATAIFLVFVSLLSLFSCNDSSGGTTPPASDTASIKNVIIIIGDGMGVEHISAGEMYSGKDFAFTNWQSVFVNTDSVGKSGKDYVLTDSAAAGTALATGRLTVNGYVGKDHTGEDVGTILDVAKSYGKATGIVTTDALYGATPAAFSAHSKSRNDTATILTSQLSSGVDLLCGSIDDNCVAMQNDVWRAGYAYCDDLTAVEDTLSSDKAYWQLALGGSSPNVALSDAAKLALDFLSQDEDGFVLMIEAAYIDKYSHNNEFEKAAKCVSALNDTVLAVLSWIGDRTDTAVLVTADHETGGLGVSMEDRFSNVYTDKDEDIYYGWSSTGHTRSKVGLFVYGIKVDFSEFTSYGSQHLIKNVDVYRLMEGVLKNPTRYTANAPS